MFILRYAVTTEYVLLPHAMNRHYLIRGFTLIETILYITITGLMISFMVSAAYQLIGSSDNISLGIIRNEEANFIIRKIGWAMAGTSAINEPEAGGVGTTLSLTKVNFSDNPIIFRVDADNLTIKKGNQNETPLNSSRVNLESFQFRHIARVGNAPAGVEVNFTIDGTPYQTTFYLR